MLQVKDIMTSEVFALYSSQSMALARFLMKLKHVRHIPIVNPDNDFVGLITHRDLLTHTISMLADPEGSEQKELDKQLKIDEIMTTEVLTVTPETSLRDACLALLEHKFGCLPVLEENKLAGIVTEADFLKLTLALLERGND
jgi:CBS domain-containing membrane protein